MRPRLTVLLIASSLLAPACASEGEDDGVLELSPGGAKEDGTSSGRVLLTASKPSAEIRIKCAPPVPCEATLALLGGKEKTTVEVRAASAGDAAVPTTFEFKLIRCMGEAGEETKSQLVPAGVDLPATCADLPKARIKSETADDTFLLAITTGALPAPDPNVQPEPSLRMVLSAAWLPI